MRTYILTLGACALLTTAGAFAAAAPTPQTLAYTPGVASTQLRVFGGRSVSQSQSAHSSKLDSALSDLSRHASLVRSGHALQDLHSLNPAARFMQTSPGTAPLVLVDAITRADPQKLKSALVSLGLQHAAVYSNDVSGWLPVSQIQNAAARSELHAIRAAMPRARSGAVTSQGDFAQRTDVLRSTYSTLTGAGITVGVISDSFNCYANYAANHLTATGAGGYATENGITADANKDASTGDIPNNVNIVEEAICMQYGAPDQPPFGDEGRATLQIVHDIAPASGLAFYTAEGGEADFANGVGALAKAGAKVITDDVGYFDEPFFQDGLVAQAIDTVQAQGVAYFSAAGNNGDNAYENLAPTFNTLSSTGQTSGEYLLNFDTTGHTTSTTLPLTIPALEPGEFIALVLEWDQPYVTGASNSGGATSALDLCVTGASGNDLILNLDGNAVTCTGTSGILGKDPVQVLVIGYPDSNPVQSQSTPIHLNLTVGLASGTPPGRIKFALEANGAAATIDAFATHSPTIQGHSGAAGAISIGAAAVANTPRCGLVTEATMETFSSLGSVTILFDKSGTRLASPLVRQKPDFVAPDRVSNTFLGRIEPAGYGGSSISQCQYDTTYPVFAGTSAATPHAGSIAALMMQANPAVTPAQIYAALQSTALPMGSTTPDSSSGYGFVQADAAMAQLPPGAPTLSLASTSIETGSSTTLTWSSINTTGCTASGGWSGAQAISGTATVAPTAVGTATYTLTCSNAVGSASSSVDLGVTAKPSGGGGGGSLDELALLTLAGLIIARVWRTRRSAVSRHV